MIAIYEPSFNPLQLILTNEDESKDGFKPSLIVTYLLNNLQNQ